MTRPIVRVLFKSKWYGLFVQLHDELHEEPFPDMGDYERLGSPYLDHAPNPRHVVAWAEQRGYDIDPLSLELIIGRWELEATRNYDDLWSDT